MKNPLREWEPVGAAILKYLFDNSISLTLFKSLEDKLESQKEEIASQRAEIEALEGDFHLVGRLAGLDGQTA